MQDSRQTSRGNLASMLGQDFKESAHVRAFEMMREIHRHREVSHRWHKFTILIHYADRIAKVRDSNLVYGDPARIQCTLDVFHGQFTRLFQPRPNIPPTKTRSPRPLRRPSERL